MKNKQGLTIAALIIAIVGLSIGFAAFSNTLTISSSASVNPSDENFIVQFSKVSGADQTGSEYPIVPNSETYGDNAIINSSDKKLLEGVHAKFTAPGQSVTYTLYVRNTGAYVAYLKELAFANAEHATSGETYKHCYAATKDSNNQDIAPANQATPTLVSTACQGISISVTIGTATNLTYSATPISLGNQALSANGGNVQAIITISYDSNAAYVDGPMEVEFGDISFTASSNPAVEQQQENEPLVQDNPWATRLQTNNVVVDEFYYLNGDSTKNNKYKFYANGGAYMDILGEFSNANVEGMIGSAIIFDEESMFVNTGSFIMLFVYDAPGQFKAYALDGEDMVGIEDADDVIAKYTELGQTAATYSVAD